MDGVEPHAAEERAKAGHGLQQGEGMRVMVWGRLDARAFAVSPQLLVRGAQGPGALEGLWDSRGGTALGDTLTVGVVSTLLPALGQGRLAVGIVPMGAAVSAVAPQMRTSPEQRAYGAPLGGRARGLWAPPPAQEGRHRG